MEEKYLDTLLKMVPGFVKQQNMWVQYDKDVDVLYIDVLNSDRVDHAILTDDEFIIRYTSGEIAGITVLDAAGRKPPIVSEEYIREKQKTGNRTRDSKA
jgi:uncharacterized protein YuzE